MASESEAGPPPANDDPVHVRIRDVKKSYGEYAILKSVSFDLYRGQTNVIVGASGSGKTVFLRQLIRLEKPDSGRIEVDGQDIVPLRELELNDVRKKFGMVFQMSALFDSMDVFDNVAFPLREHTKLGKAEIRSKVEEALAALGVGHAIKKLPSELSGGMRKRVAVARALVLKPAILIYDEPTTGLDPITSRTVDELIESTREQFGVTSVVISHDMQSVFNIGHRITLLYKGEIEESSDRDTFMQSQNEHVREILDASGVALPGSPGGSSQANARPPDPKAPASQTLPAARPSSPPVGNSPASRPSAAPPGKGSDSRPPSRKKRQR